MKPKMALKNIQDNLKNMIKENEKYGLEVNLPEPDKNLYSFNGLVKYSNAVEQNKSYDVELKQFLHSVSCYFYHFS